MSQLCAQIELFVLSIYEFMKFIINYSKLAWKTVLCELETIKHKVKQNIVAMKLSKWFGCLSSRALLDWAEWNTPQAKPE